MKKREKKQEIQRRPKLVESEDTHLISFKVPESLLKAIIARCKKLKFFKKNGDPAKSEYIRHSIENEINISKYIEDTVKNEELVAMYEKAINDMNQYKSENIGLRNDLARALRQEKKKERKKRMKGL